MSTEIDTALNTFEQQFINKLASLDLSPCFPKIREVIATSISRNFQEGGRFGNDNPFGGGTNKWTPSRRASKDTKKGKPNRTGKTLLDTTQLLQSSLAGINISQSGLILNIELGSNKEYAPIHQFGGNIETTAGERESKWKATGSKKTGYKYRFAKATSKTKNTISRKYKVGAHTIVIPARPYLVLQNEDLIEILNIIQEFVIKELNK